ncbi:MAG: hypothetical protein GX548_06260 [Lentisphaerae bacterium]|nr:hypothetical protein [Lentisphaerota bacterium]
MKTPTSNSWNRLRAAYRPSVPDLDTGAIMKAVREEAAKHPLRRPAANAVASIPTWACAAAASLAFLAAASVMVQSVNQADRQIGQAWISTVPPEEFAQTFLAFSDPSPL